MPWIKVIQERQAEGELKKTYETMRELNASYGETSEGRTQVGEAPVSPPQLSSLNPKAMLHAKEFMLEIMRGPSRLTPAQREMIATVTSLTASCRF